MDEWVSVESALLSDSFGSKTFIYLCLFICVWGVCTCMCTFTCLCACTPVEAWSWHRRFSSFVLQICMWRASCWTQGSLAMASLSRQLGLEIPSLSSEYWDSMSWLLHGSGNPNSCPYTCMGNVLSTEPSPQSTNNILKTVITHSESSSTDLTGMDSRSIP